MLRRLIARQVKPTTIIGSRTRSFNHYSTKQVLTPEEAKGKAQAIINLLPGDSMLKKTTYATLGSGLAAYLISQGIYIVNEESIILVSFLVVARAIYNKVSGPIAAFLEGTINDIRVKLQGSAMREIKAVEGKIAELESFRDHHDATSEFMEWKRDNIRMEAQLEELEQENQFLAGINSKLAEMARREQEKQALERAARLEKLIAGIMAEIREPKFQERFLKQAMSDLEKVVAK